MHGSWLRAVAIARLRGFEGADDVMQDVAIGAMRNWETLRTAANAKAWLYRLTVRAVPCIAVPSAAPAKESRRPLIPTPPDTASPKAPEPSDPVPIHSPLSSHLNATLNCVSP